MIFYYSNTLEILYPVYNIETMNHEQSFKNGHFKINGVKYIKNSEEFRNAVEKELLWQKLANIDKKEWYE